MSSMPYLTLVSKQSTYVHDNYNQSRFHFVENFFNQYGFQFRKKMTKLLFNQKNIFHQWNFYVSKELFSRVQLRLTETIIFIIPASIASKTKFHQSSFYLR